MVRYQHECVTLAGFIQQLAVAYVAKGYWFYVSGVIPERKDPARTDRKLMTQYGIGISKWARARKKKAGQANLHYLRHERFWVVIATRGEGVFFEAEGDRVRDIRESPLCYCGYSVSYRRGRGGGRWHASVRIERRQYLELKAYFEEMAPRWTVERLTRELAELPFERYAPVRNQVFMIWRAINRRRKVAGLEPVPREVLPWRRRPVRPFESGPMCSDEE